MKGKTPEKAKQSKETTEPDSATKLRVKHYTYAWVRRSTWKPAAAGEGGCVSVLSCVGLPGLTGAVCR